MGRTGENRPLTSSPTPREVTYLGSGGNRWLDMCGQLAYVNIGHAHPRVVDAIKRQAETMPLIAPDTPARRPAGWPGCSPRCPRSALADLLHQRRGGGERARDPDGARLHRPPEDSDPLPELPRRDAGGHGGNRRLAAPDFLRAAHAGRVRQDPRSLSRYRCRFCAKESKCNLNCADAVEAPLARRRPGNGGGHPPRAGQRLRGIRRRRPDGYLQRLRDLCDEHGILLCIFDEVIDGFCRTGKWFASEH